MPVSQSYGAHPQVCNHHAAQVDGDLSRPDFSCDGASCVTERFTGYRCHHRGKKGHTPVDLRSTPRERHYRRREHCYMHS